MSREIESEIIVGKQRSQTYFDINFKYFEVKITIKKKRHDIMSCLKMVIFNLNTSV